MKATSAALAAPAHRPRRWSTHAMLAAGVLLSLLTGPALPPLARTATPPAANVSKEPAGSERPAAAPAVSTEAKPAAEGDRSTTAGREPGAKKAPIKGIVQDENLQPISGAIVTVVAIVERDESDERSSRSPGGPGLRFMLADRLQRPDWDAEAPTFFTGKTDAGGAFIVDAEGDGPFNLRIDAAGLAPAMLERVRPGEATSPIVLKSGSHAAGVVADIATGRPVVDAEVLATPDDDRGFKDPADPKRFAAAARTARDGSFRLQNLPEAFHTFRVTAPARGLLEAAGKPVGERDARPLLFYLEPGFDLTGRVLDPAGKPVEGKTVLVTAGRASPGALLRAARDRSMVRPSARTDKDGRFTLKGIALEGKHSLEVRTKEYAPAIVEITPPRSAGAAPSLEIRLEKGVTLKGKLVDADEKPVSSKVELGLTYRDTKTRRAGINVQRGSKDVRVQPTGEFVTDRLPSGTARVRIQVEGFKAVERKDVAVGREAKATDLGTIVLDRGKTITGRVVDGDGKPVQSAKVMPFPSGRGGGGGRPASVTADATGRFVIDGVGDGTWGVEASAKGYSPVRKEDVEPGGDPIEIALTRAGSLKGRVVVGDPPKPVSNFTIQADPKESGGGAFRFLNMGGTSRKVSDPGGQFALGDLAPGAYTLILKAEGLQDLVHEGAEVRGGEATDVGDLTLRAGGTIRGRVAAQPGDLPVAGAAVRVKKSGMFNFRAMLGGGDAVTLTDLVGRFELRGLPVGQVTLSIEPETYAKAEVSGNVVEAGEAAEELVVTVGKGGRIEGRVLGPDGTPQANGVVSASASLVDFSARQAVTTDEQGHYAIENVAPGSYRVTTVPFPMGEDEEEEEGGRRAARNAGLDSLSTDVKDGQTSIVNFGEKKIKVSGSVKRREGVTGEMQIMFLPDSGGGQPRMSMKMTTADEVGRYEVSLNEPGDYFVRVGSRDGPAGTMIKVKVPDRPEFSYDIVFPEGGLAGRVTEEQTGAPLKGVMVLASPSRGKDEAPRSIRGRPGSNASTSEDGSYRIEGLTPGSWDLTFIHDGYGTETRQVEVKGSDEVPGVDQLMAPGTPFTLRIVSGAGVPVSGALVFTSQGGTPLIGVGGVSQEDGSIEMKQLKPGLYSFVALTRDLAPGLARDVSVGGEEDADSTVVTLTPGGTARIVVRDGSKQAVSGATVAIESTAEPDLDTALQAVMAFAGGQPKTSSDGSVTINHLPSGKLEATIMKGSQKVTKTISIEEGATAELAVTLE